MSNSFTIYNASAGSGKTFTLVKEYLVLILTSKKKDSYRNILAITFTNKAVDEMKNRIIKSLYDFSREKIPNTSRDLFSAVAQESGLSPQEIKQKSAGILKSIIHNYAAFEISTIDGFTHRVLRTFAKDLGLPVNFEVELNTRQLLMEAVESLISKAGAEKTLTQTLIDFALTKTDDDKSWDITRDLFEIAELLTNENNQIALKALKGKTQEDFDKFSQKLNEEIALAKQQKTAFAKTFFELLESNGLEEQDFNGKFLPNHFKKLLTGRGSPNFEAQWVQKLYSENLYKKSFKDEIKKRLLDSLQSQIVNLFDASKAVYFQLEFFTEIRKKLVQLSLLNTINGEIEVLKKERNLVMISEFNPQISAQVKDQPAPFIYERLGERYNNYFIDEFQDTSLMQWENLIPLIDHSLSGMSDNGDTATLMLVGDAKQSIYRWRGGKAEQFIQLSLDNNPFSIDKKVENLPYNFRSGGEIVNFNNKLFNHAADYLNHPEYKKLFKESSQSPRKGDSGYVNLSFIEAENREEEYEIYPGKVLEIIKDLEGKGFPKSDICILTRTRNEGVSIANYLSENDLSVVSSETLLIANSPETNFITDVLEFSLKPDNSELKLRIFAFLEEHLSLENPHKIIAENLKYQESDFFSWLKPYEIDFNLEHLKQLSVYEAAEYIIRSFNLIRDSNAYIQFFLDFVFETTQKSSAGIQEFLEYWEQEKEKLSIVVPAEEDAVQIMTIHKSKGLEFPVVIYPFANSAFQDTKKDALWLDLDPPLDTIPVSYISASKKMTNWGKKAETAYNTLLNQKELDALNVLYVACTRASRQLYILSKLDLDKEGNEKKDNTSGLLIGFLKATGKWDGNLSYEFGNIGNPKVRNAEQQQVSQPAKFFSCPIQNAAVNIITRSGSLWDTRQEEAIEKGQIVHDILAGINTAEDLKTQVENAVTDGIITKESAEKINQLLEKIVSHPLLREYYIIGVSNYNERDILLDNGRRIRPDRLNFKGKQVTIIDYKTGGYKEAHTTQIEEYATALSEMGFEVENKILVYLKKDLLVRFE